MYFNVALIRNIIAIQITITVQYNTVVASTTIVPIKIMPNIIKNYDILTRTIGRKYHNSPSKTVLHCFVYCYVWI